MSTHCDLDDGDGNRLPTKTLVCAESKELIVVLEDKFTMSAVKPDMQLFTECNGSAVRLVECKGIVLAEMFLQELLLDFVCHIGYPP